MQNINQIMGYISKTSLFGVLPLDLLLHFVIGAVLTILLLTRKYSYAKTLLIIVLLSLAKEIYDVIFVYPAHWSEYIQDFFTSIVWILLVGLTRLYKKKQPPETDIIKF